MENTDLSRISQIHEEIPSMPIHDVALIAIENQLYRIAEALTRTEANPVPEVEQQLDPEEKAAVGILQKAFAELQEKNIFVGK